MKKTTLIEAMASRASRAFHACGCDVLECCDGSGGIVCTAIDEDSARMIADSLNASIGATRALAAARASNARRT